MSHTFTLHRGRLADGRLVDLRVVDGALTEVTAVGPGADPSARGAGAALGAVDFDAWVADGGAYRGPVDLAGRLVLPPLVNGHVHLDKTFVGAPWQPHRSGATVAERVAHERDLRAEVDVPVAHRAAALAELLVASGTGLARTHVDVDPDARLAHLEQVLTLREQLVDVLDLQVVAFPQSGIVTAPGVADLLDQGLRLGADVVGGLDPAGFDGDAQQHLDVVFALAERHGARVDIHLHELGAAGGEQLRLIAERTAALGLHGRVAVSHAYGLGTLGAEETRRCADVLASAGVAVMTNGPAGPMPPVLLLRERGVTVFSGTDNVRDAWWPYGDGDMLTIARTVAYQQGFRSDDELGVALDLVTGSAARALGAAGYGLLPGAPADLVVVEATCAAEAVAAPARRTVVRSGVPRSSVATTPVSVPDGTDAPEPSPAAPTHHPDDSAVGQGLRPDPRLTPSRS
ncbi:amidohydrolase family protein [Cellulomonas sp. DKR-3]|uniref:Amidohydrolase family protein n=1 Tax=Cellulomonas fulva TaxID=2835530 RepID=A0ABS5TX30_9CELL|nr:amidohydrolase [Cellulomonas fulva]MBT0993700.1 amidohydrolase family protein [Cellulomonas fulva]